jgi:arylsulfatase A-like enzyme
MKKFLPFLALLILLGSCTNPSAVDSGPPNILFIMADDHTSQAISCYEGIFAEKAATHNIDRIAEQGMRFTQAFCTNSICTPSRATILTGKYSHMNGNYTLYESFDTTQVTSTRILRAAGYETAVFGKWHLHSTPPDFDEYMVLPKQGRYQDPQFYEKDIDTLVTRKGWSTDVIADRTMEFMRERDREKPFFVMCHFKATHDPWDARPPYDTLFSNEEMPRPDNLFDQYENRAEPSRRTTLKLEYMTQNTFPHDRLAGVDELSQREYIYEQYIRSFLQCGRVLDENVGRILDFLEKEGLDENTIVIYTADQGHFLGEHGLFSKRFMYEEAMRMPLIVRYPGRIAPGSVNHELVANIDFAPTLISLAGLPVPEEMQGTSIVPLLEGQTPEDWREAIYYRYWQHLLHRQVTAHYGIRTASHKLIYFHGLPCGKTDFPPVEPSWELFDLKEDPAEMMNLYHSEDHQDLIRELKENMLRLKEVYGDYDSDCPGLEEQNLTYFW